MPGTSPGTQYLLQRLALVEHRVRAAVAARQATDPKPDDAFRGLYLSAESAQRLLDRAASEDPPALDPDLASDEAGASGEAGDRAAVEEWADQAEAAGAVLPLRALAADFGLGPLDTELLLIALLPDADARFEQLYGYLNDDVSRRRASTGLALELLGASPLQESVRSRLSPAAPLVAGGLLLVEEPDRPFLSRPLRVPDRVVAHLLGEHHPDPELRGLLTTAAELPSSPPPVPSPRRWPAASGWSTCASRAAVRPPPWPPPHCAWRAAPLSAWTSPRWPPNRTPSCCCRARPARHGCAAAAWWPARSTPWSRLAAPNGPACCGGWPSSRYRCC